MIQGLDQAAENAAKYLQLMKERGLSSEGLEFLAEAQEKVLLKKWVDPIWRRQAIEKRGQPKRQRGGEEGVKTDGKIEQVRKRKVLFQQCTDPEFFRS